MQAANSEAKGAQRHAVLAANFLHRSVNVINSLFESVGRLMPSCKGAKLMDGKVFKGNVGHQELAAWVEGLGL